MIKIEREASGFVQERAVEKEDDHKVLMDVDDGNKPPLNDNVNRLSSSPNVNIVESNSRSINNVNSTPATATSSSESNSAPLPFWNHPIMYFICIHIVVVLHGLSWWAFFNQPLRKHLISPPLTFIQKTIPEVNQNISSIISEYIIPSEDTVVSTSFLSSPLFGFIILPLAELILWPFKGADYLYSNHKIDKKLIDEQTKKYKFMYRLVPLIYTFSLTAVVCFSLAHVHLLNFSQFLMHSFSLGVAIAQSGVMSHEMLHKTALIENIFARVLLSMHNYLHFPLEHVYSHHKKLATKEDAATARFGEMVYTFVIRSSVSGYFNAWRIDLERVKKRGWLKSEMMWATIVTVLLPVFIFHMLGLKALISFVVTSLIAIFFIESVNYVEHYGLLRKKINGEYEPVNETHSYDALFRVSSYSYFNIIFHADHHFYGMRDYYKLRVYENSPKLPYGYSTMILFSFIPPLFFNLMTPLVFDFYEKQGIDYFKLLNQQ